MTSRRTFIAGLAPLVLCPTAALCSPALNLKDFGAVGDGVTDDTAAWLAFCAATGSRRYIPRGRYVVSRLGRLPQGVVEGDGPGMSVLWQPAWSRSVEWGQIPGKSVVRDLTLYADAALGESHRISTAPHAEWVNLENVAVQGFRDGYGLMIGYQANHVTIDKSLCESGFWGLTIVDAHTVTASRTIIRTTGVRAPLDIEPDSVGCWDIRISECVLDGRGAAQFAANLWGGSANIGGVTIQRNDIRNCQKGLQFYRAGSVKVCDNEFKNVPGPIWTDWGGTTLTRSGNLLNGMAIEP